MQKRTVPTPTTSQEIYPPKRIKINATRSKKSISELEKLNHVDTKMENSNEQESGPLRSIPLPVLLLAQAQIHQSSLINLQPILSLPPDPSTSTYAETYVHYVRSLGSAVAALRCIINNGNNGGHGMGGGRIELRARCELAEFLIRYLNTKPDGGSNMSLEVEGIISKGIAAAQKHESFSEFQYRLYSLSAELSLLQDNVKFAKSTLKRSITSLTSTNTLLHPEWLYSAYLSLASIAINEDDYPVALYNYKEMEKLSKKRGDLEMFWTIQVLIAKLALGEKEWDLVGGIVEEIGKMLGILPVGDIKPEVKSEKVVDSTQLPPATPVIDQGFLGRQFRVQFFVIFCLYQAQIGNVKIAKEKLKIAHGLLDEKNLEEGDAEGWARITIAPGELPTAFSSRASAATSSPMNIQSSGVASSPTLQSSLSVQIAVPPRHLMYSYAFLVSVAVHRDPFGSKPRSKLFANEGLRIVNNMISGQEPRLSAEAPPSHLKAALKTISKMKISLLLFSAELDILRSSYSDALQFINEAIATCRTDDQLWNTYQLRITLAMATLYQAQALYAPALECFEVVVKIGSQKGEQDMVTLARVSILMIQLSQFTIQQSKSTQSLSNSKSIKKSVGLDHSTLTRQILSFTTKANLPCFKLLGEFTSAISGGEIIKAKQHLSNALNLSNTTMANHCKALMLALLANLFIWTRNDQAQKMLTASFTILRGMGSRNESSVAHGEEFDKDNIVGNSKLGLWVGERLLECYKREENSAKVKRQETYNAAHRRVLARDV